MVQKATQANEWSPPRCLPVRTPLPPSLCCRPTGASPNLSDGHGCHAGRAMGHPVNLISSASWKNTSCSRIVGGSLGLGLAAFLVTAALSGRAGVADLGRRSVLREVVGHVP